MRDPIAPQHPSPTEAVRFTVVLLLVMIACVALCVTSAQALERCAVKVDKDTGAMQVDARGLVGPLRWGSVEGQAINTFYDQSCLSPNRARKCLLADPASAVATTPPESCWLYLADDVDTCAAFVVGCTPGVREFGPDERFGIGTGLAHPGRGASCVLGEVWLMAGAVASATPAEGQSLSISEHMALYSLLGTMYGGDGRTKFSLPDLRDAAPNGLTYVICTNGTYPSRY